MSAQVLADRLGGVVTLTLANAERKNALSGRMLHDLEEHLDQLERDRTARVVVLTGSDRWFCVGADLAQAPTERFLRRDEGDFARLRWVSTLMARLHELPQVTIAAVNGACAGAGLSLAMAADLRIASRSAVLNTAFLDAGLPGDLGAIWFVTQALGRARTAALYLLPEKLDAEQARAAGLLTSVVDADRLQGDVSRVAARLAAAAPLALHDMKLNLAAAAAQPLRHYLVDEVDRAVRCFASEDALEAAAAFVEKRAPQFTGR